MKNWRKCLFKLLSIPKEGWRGLGLHTQCCVATGALQTTHTNTRQHPTGTPLPEQLCLGTSTRVLHRHNPA